MGDHSIYEIITRNNYIRAWRHGGGDPGSFGVELAEWVMTVMQNLDAVCQQVDKVIMVQPQEISTQEARIQLAQRGVLSKKAIRSDLTWWNAIDANHPDEILKAGYCSFPIYNDHDYIYTIDLRNGWMSVRQIVRANEGMAETTFTWKFEEFLDMGTVRDLTGEYIDACHEVFEEWEKEEEEREANKRRDGGRH